MIGEKVKNTIHSTAIINPNAVIGSGVTIGPFSIVDANVNNILKANVHLNPSDNIPTSQTGTRHRTAERVSVETELSVIAVSEESSTIKVFSDNSVNELEESSIIFGKVNESLQSIDRTRRRFDDAVLELGELEVENTLTNQQVLEVIQKGYSILDRTLRPSKVIVSKQSEEK